MTEPARAMFMYDVGRQALVFFAPDGSGRIVAVPLAHMQQLGWKATHEGMAASLPRFAPPTPAPPAIQVAPDMHASRALQRSISTMRGGRR